MTVKQLTQITFETSIYRMATMGNIMSGVAMYKRFSWSVLMLFCSFSAVASAQTTLSVNSGINSQDTYVIMDMTTQSTGSVQLASPAYNPQTQTTTSTFTLAPGTTTFHVEVGYDSSGSPVTNLIPQTTSGASALLISSIRIANGQMTPFDNNGNPVTVAMPTKQMQTGWPINLPGVSTPNRVRPGANPRSATSILAGMVISNIQEYAQVLNLTLTINGNTALLRKANSTSPVLVWQYTQQGSGWVLQSITTTLQDSAGTSSRQVQFSNVTYVDNASNDAARQSGGSSNLPSPSDHTSSTSTDSSKAPAPQLGNPGTYTNTNLGGSQNVLFQHGFYSSGQVWGRMTGWLNQDFLFGNEVIPSLSATASLSSQGQNLNSILQAAGGNQYILIGHSQGGLISRYTGQYFQQQQSPAVRGIITIDTPHLGADLTETGPQAIGQGVSALANRLYGQFGCLSPTFNYGCYISDLIYIGGAALAKAGVDSIGALNDLTPGSSFLTQLNGTTENFQRAAVISQTPQRWLVARVADEVSGTNPDDPLGERNAALITEFVYDAVLFDLTVASIEEVEWYNYCVFGGGIDEGDPYCDYDFSQEINQDLSIMNTMDQIDGFYNGLIAPNGDGSDGFVQNTSQVYPSSSAVQYTIPNGDSHQGATRSPFVHTALDYLLANTFSVPTPAACTYSVNPSSVSVANTGGSFSVSLSSASGCPWSVAIGSPWVTGESGSTSGSGSATLTFDVQSETSNIPRYASITIGNGFSTTTVTVNQGGVSTCSYSVSPTSVQGGGLHSNSFDIQLTTQVGCTWSVSPSQPWLSVQNSAGTGSGTFTLSTGRSGYDGEMGVATVGGQTVSVNISGYCCKPQPGPAPKIPVTYPIP